MENKFLSHHGFMRKSLATDVTPTGVLSFGTSNRFDPKGPPTFVFGKTSVRIPVMDSLNIVKSNIEIQRSFTPIDSHRNVNHAIYTIAIFHKMCPGMDQTGTQ